MNLPAKSKYLDYSEAICAQTDPEAFFPESGESTRYAKSICAKCPVRTDCLLEALANGYTDGVWGGLSPRERQQLKRNKGQAVALGIPEVVFRGRPPRLKRQRDRRTN
jgi:hypothetical protein